MIDFHSNLRVIRVTASCSRFIGTRLFKMSFAYRDPGGGTPLHGLYRYMRLQRVGFFSRFGHK